jgi:hypothetical protein
LKASKVPAVKEKEEEGGETATEIARKSFIKNYAGGVSVSNLTEKEIEVKEDFSTKSCEVLKDLKVCGLDVVDNKEVLFIKYPDNLSKDTLYKNINNLLKDLESVNSKGFINVLDINKYPVISDLVGSFTKHPKFIKGKDIFETYK